MSHRPVNPELAECHSGAILIAITTPCIFDHDGLSSAQLWLAQ
jgi:hypothetical protein